MKILRGILVIGGAALIAFALYHALVPQESPMDASEIIDNAGGFTNQTVGMIGIGILAIIASVLSKKRG